MRSAAILTALDITKNSFHLPEAKVFSPRPALGSPSSPTVVSPVIHRYVYPQPKVQNHLSNLKSSTSKIPSGRNELLYGPKLTAAPTLTLSQSCNSIFEPRKEKEEKKTPIPAPNLSRPAPNPSEGEMKHSSRTTARHDAINFDWRVWDTDSDTDSNKSDAEMKSPLFSP